MKLQILFFSTLFLFFSCSTPPSDNASERELVIVGAGAAGVSAALHAARKGISVHLIEETPWLGGMLSASGVSAVDGNHKLPSGIWGEFRQKLYDYYGGPEAVETGWVSNTLFEPHVADSLLKVMVGNEPNITVHYNTKLIDVVKTSNQITELTVQKDNAAIIFKNPFIIDATEMGEVMGMANIPHFIGQDPPSRFGESIETPANEIIQDLTYVAILKTGDGLHIEKPANYDPLEFDCSCKEQCSDPEKRKKLVSCAQMLTYGKLPNGAYMINWPTKGNDHYVNLLKKTEEERAKAMEEAKETTRRFVYFIQTEVGADSLLIATDEFPTEDHFPLIPYHRESRRLNALQMVTVDYLNEGINYKEPLYKYGISVGDYPLDHHRDKNPNKPEKIDFPSIPSFSVPLGSIIPKSVENILVAEKSYGVSSLANGSTRLQPVVMLTGQAAGALAAHCMMNNIPAAKVNVRDIQQDLIDANAYCSPLVDVPQSDPDFKVFQKAAVTGLLKVEGVPYKWANRTYMYPDTSMVEADYIQAIETLQKMDFENVPTSISDPNAKSWFGTEGDTMTRREFVKLIDRKYNLFSKPLNF